MQEQAINALYGQMSPIQAIPTQSHYNPYHRLFSGYGGTGVPSQMMHTTQDGNANVAIGYQSPPPPKIVETDEFKKLYNHKFHELLDEFEELRSKVT